MKRRILTANNLNDFQKYLILQEKSKATTKKYFRDAKVFADFAGNEEIRKEIVIAYKEHLRENRSQCELDACKHKQPVCVFRLV